MMKCDNVSTFIKSQQGSIDNSRLDTIVERMRFIEGRDFI